jgi:hypothetical protein
MDETVNEGATAPLPEPEPGAPAEGAPAADAPVAPEAPMGHPMAPGYAPQAVPPLGYTSPAPRASRMWQVPTRWVAIVAGVIAAMVLLGVAFGVGVGVGRHSARFDSPLKNRAMQIPYGSNGQNDRNRWQNAPDDTNPYDYDYRGYGGHRRTFPRGVPSPNTTTTP